MRNITVGLVIGTRPEAIKLAPVAGALSTQGLQPWIFLTGQHPGLGAAEHGLEHFEVTPLGCAGHANPSVYADWVSEALHRCWHPCGPALALVLGGTSSALGGARAALGRQLPLGHVEAGLRTFDAHRPWPEEEFRAEIDRHADLLFAPTAGNAENLRREGAPGLIQVTGSTGIDALKGRLPRRALRLWRGSKRQHVLATCHRRENWGDGIDRVCGALQRMAASGRATVDFVLHPNPKVSERVYAVLGQKHGIRLLPPQSGDAIINAMRRADVLVSDSGGMQEEAAALGLPMLVLRDKTERPESIASGNAVLVGTDPDAITSWLERLAREPALRARMSRPAFPFGEGDAALRIAAACRTFLETEAEQTRLIA